MINFKDLPPEEKKALAEEMFKPLESADKLREWIVFFFGLDMPIGHIDPDSNSSPIEAMWEIYSCIKENKGEDNPGYIMLSAREGYKTLSASILETLLLVHFRLTIAHLAAIQAQSAKAIQYINFFFNKIQPLLEVSGWSKTSENKSKVSFRTKEGDDAYIRVIVATMAGANCIDPAMVLDTDRGNISAQEVYDLVRNNECVMVLSFNHKTNELEYKEVTHTFDSIKTLVTIELENGSIIKCSPEHRFYIEGKGYMEAKDLTEEDYLSVK